MEGNRHLTLVYQQKADAPTSYYLQSGEKGILPNRICITQNQFADVKSKIKRNPRGQMKATFKKSESSQYCNNTRTLHSNIYPLQSSTSAIIGTGDIRGTNDLLIFEDRSGGYWKEIVIHIFPGAKFKVSIIIHSYFK